MNEKFGKDTDISYYSLIQRVIPSFALSDTGLQPPRINGK
jgi:hypothetical protein